jgi:hypothetical protein
MKAHEFDKVVTKLGMETRDTTHRHAWLVHNGVTVVRTKRSHGGSKFVPEDLIRKQLHVNKDEFAGLQSCTVSKDDYIRQLTEWRSATARTNPYVFSVGESGNRPSNDQIRARYRL